MERKPTTTVEDQHEHQLIALALDSLPNGVMITDTEYRITLVNRQARHMLGLSAVPLAKGVEAKMGVILEKVRSLGEQPAPFLMVLFKPERLFVWVYTNPLRGFDGELLGFVIELRDITQTQDSTRRSLEIASFIVHRFPELSEQLSNQVTLVENPDLQGKMSQLHREINRQVNKLVAFTELEAGPLRIQRMPMCPDEILNAAVEHHQRLAAEHKHTFSCDLKFGDEFIDADEDWIQKLVHILIENALMYSPEGSSIEVRSQRTEDGKFRCIIRNPVEVPPDQDEAERLFDLHRQLQEFEASLDEDFSLELPLARQIVQAHGGLIAIDPGNDLVFSVAFEI